MQRMTHNLVQGSAPWHEHRSRHYSASDASAMMGASKYRTRNELIREKATGIVPEIDPYKQRLFDRGHAAEAAIRPVIEQMIGAELFPVTMSCEVDGLPLSASLDGLSMDGETAFECKLWNEDLAAKVRSGNLDPHYIWQLEQQLLVSGAKRVIFATGDGDQLLETMEYRPASGSINELIAGWKQFASDVAAYVPGHPKDDAIASPVAGFGSLSLRVEGRVLASNLDTFKAEAEAFISQLPKPSDLQSDQDFADADAAAKACGDAESRIKSAREAALAQMADVDSLLRTADSISEVIRAARIALEKAVKTEKDRRKADIIDAGRKSIEAHVAEINATMGEHALQTSTPVLIAELGAAIKGKRTLSSMTDAVDAVVANRKVEFSQQAERVRANVAILAEAGHAELFADRIALCRDKAPDDLRNLIKTRIADHEQRQAEARERIRREEAERIERAAQAARDVETAKVIAESIKPEPAPKQDTAAAPMPARVKLGQINEAIAPLSITADGLAQLGFKPVGTERAAKLYDASQFDAIRDALIGVISRSEITKKKAAA